MGGTQGLAPVNEAVRLLDRLAPDRLVELREQFQQVDDAEFEPGIMAGEAETEVATETIITARARIMIAALDEAISRAQPAVSQSRNRLRNLARIRFAVQALTLLGSATLLGTTALGQHRWQLIAAMITFAAALGTAFVDFANRLLTGDGATRQQAYEALSTCLHQARQTRTEIDLLLRFDPHGQDIQNSIGKANALAETINRWLDRL